jgi:hypothetical protein
MRATYVHKPETGISNMCLRQVTFPIGGLSLQSENSIIGDRGSIDTTNTRNVVCTIFEGSLKASKRRHHLYGF